MKKGKQYRFKEIYIFSEENGYELNELGRNYIGENFVVLTNEKGETISFVLKSTDGSNYIYECVYLD